jgi:hypothetical protein
VALGDAPESVAGVKTLGVLHAPGYPSYVLLAHAFAKVVPIGDWALRVNLFSLVCAALTVAAVFLLARSFGASLLGAGVGALTLATSASFWFNAGFAKHYALSGLLVAGAALAASLWQHSGKISYLVVAGALLGTGFGASWELALVMTVGIALLLWFGPKRPPVLTAVAAGLALVVLAVAMLAFMVVRARQHPGINWGEVTNTHRVATQISQQDFRKSDPQSGATTALTSVPGRLLNYLGMLVRDVGLGACLVAAAGIAVAVTRLSRGRKLFLAVVAVLNLIAVAFATGVDTISGFFTGIFAGGFLIAVLVVVAVLVALGTTPAIDFIAGKISQWATPRRHRSRASTASSDVRPYVALLLVAVVLVPSILVHHRYADHRMPPLADRYAQRVLAELPPRAVLLVADYELSEPMRYRQLVDGERPDVVIVSSDLLGLQWYRDQVSRALGTALPPGSSNGDEAVALVKQLRSKRPVFLDTLAMYFLGSGIGYRAQGFVGVVVDGTGPHAAAGNGVTAADLDRADRADGLGSTRYLRFPNELLYYIHQRAHIELAKQLLMRGDQRGVQQQLERAVALVPTDTPSQIVLRHLRQHDPKAADLVRAL